MPKSGGCPGFKVNLDAPSTWMLGVNEPEKRKVDETIWTPLCGVDAWGQKDNFKSFHVEKSVDKQKMVVESIWMPPFWWIPGATAPPPPLCKPLHDRCLVGFV